MPRRDNHSNHDQENHERWLVSYADFITLLFAFFVVMYSISSVNEGKYKVLSETLIGAFNVPEKSAAKPEAINLKEYEKNSMIDFPGRANKDGDITSEIKQKGEGSGSGLDQLSRQVEAAFADLVEDNNIAIDGNETWVEISLNSNLLFASGSARPSERAVPIIRQIADILGGYENPVHVEGFTDNVPINTELFPSNWELSAARSATVVRLLAQEGVDPDRLAAVGYGEFQPKASNATVEGRNSNRRVVLVVSRDLNVRRSVSGAGELGANTERELSLKDAEEKRSSFLKEKNRVKSVELEGGGILFTQDDKK
jgi:chemotaxis protein MotB